MIARGLYINIFDQVWTQKWSKWAKIMQKKLTFQSAYHLTHSNMTLDHTAQIGKTLAFGLGKVTPNQFV